MANMGAEVGATSSTFPYTPNMRSYLRSTGRSSVADAADEAAHRGFLMADEGAEYDEVLEIVRDHLTPFRTLSNILYILSEFIGFRTYD